MTLDEIKEALSHRVLTTVERETGINRTTLHQIKAGQHENPTKKTMDRLAAYLAPMHPKAEQ